jgi:hypothetical protein
VVESITKIFVDVIPARAVIPAKAGIHCGFVGKSKMDSRLRWNDGNTEPCAFYAINS